MRLPGIYRFGCFLAVFVSGCARPPQAVMCDAHYLFRPAAEVIVPDEAKISRIELKLTDWNLRCENEYVALFCGTGEREREMRCGAKRDGRFMYTFGRMCKNMGCYVQGC